MLAGHSQRAGMCAPISASSRMGPTRTAAVADAALNFRAVTSGGASQGEEDHVVRSIEALGKRHLWQIAINPDGRWLRPDRR